MASWSVQRFIDTTRPGASARAAGASALSAAKTASAAGARRATTLRRPRPRRGSEARGEAKIHGPARRGIAFEFLIAFIEKVRDTSGQLHFVGDVMGEAQIHKRVVAEPDAVEIVIGVAAEEAGGLEVGIVKPRHALHIEPQAGAV